MTPGAVQAIRAVSFDDLIGDVEHGAMEALADAVGLRALGFGAAVIDVFDREVELVIVALAAAEFGAAIGQHA